MSDTFKIGQKLTWHQSRKWGGKQGVPVIFRGYVGKTGNRAKVETEGTRTEESHRQCEISERKIVKK